MVLRACKHIVLGLAGALCVMSAQATPKVYRAIAERYDIPHAIFYAVAMQESGTRLASGQFRPWPWTLNVQGQSLFFATRQEAYQRILQAVKHKEIFDIGFAQVNWNWNKAIIGTSERDLWEALDPINNLELGARILSLRYSECRTVPWVKDLCDKYGDWWVSVGRYHSPGQSEIRQKRAYNYMMSVKRKWQKSI